MQALLVAIIAWLSVNYGLAQPDKLPDVRFASPVEIAEIHVVAPIHTAQPQSKSTPSEKVRKVVAIYESSQKAIILPQGWTARSPADLSLLVHEMVHYLQDLAALRYACPEEREALAYSAQEKFLGQFRTNLEKEFNIDDLTLLVTTQCAY